MSLNDPQWGKRGGGNEGPPDLDEMWRSFNQKLAGLFGRRRPQEPGPVGGHNFGGGISLMIAVVLVAWLASGFYIVVEGQRGVVLTFGKFSEVTNAGLRWRFPYPIQSHEIVDLNQIRTLEIGYRNNVKTRVLRESLMLTDDENIVDAQFSVQYSIKDAKEYLFNNRKPEETVLHAAETALREIVGTSRMDSVLYEERAQIPVLAQKLMQGILDRYEVGINIVRVTMQNSQPPDQVKDAFADAVRAKQDLERQKNEGQAYYNDVVPKARGTASRLTEEANGYRQRVVADAEGDAARFRQVLVEYNKAPAVTRQRLYLDAMQQILSNSSKVMIDAKSGSNLLYLPLEKLMQLPSPGGAPADSSGSQRPPLSTDPVSPDSGARSRDTLRNREREGRP
jgi:modulator of FtsH protease HflK